MTVPKVEYYLSFDIRYLHRNGLLKPGRLSNMRWIVGGRHVGDFSIEARSSSLVIGKQVIDYYFTEYTYGGERPWFFCPHCRRRVAKLHFVNSIFSCRKCHSLRYTSKSETPWDRKLRKARRLREKLEASPDLTIPIYCKPKGMHYKTFERLLREEAQTMKTYIAIDPYIKVIKDRVSIS